MKKWSICTIPLLVLLMACGGTEVESANVSAQSINAGDQCPSGGVILSVEDSEYVICNGSDGVDGTDGQDGENADISTRRLGPGEDDNPCGGDALEVTITPPGSDSVVEYICEAFDPVSDFLKSFYEEILVYEQERTTTFCTCEWEDDEYSSPEECVADRGIPYSEGRFVTWCIDQAYYIYDRPAPEGFFDAIECQLSLFEAQSQCLALLDNGNACAEEDFDAYFECQSDALNDLGCEIEPEEVDEETEEWFEDFGEFLSLFCGEIFS